MGFLVRHGAVDVIPNSGGIGPVGADRFDWLCRCKSADAADERSVLLFATFAFFVVAFGTFFFVEAECLGSIAFSGGEAFAAGEDSDVGAADFFGGGGFADGLGKSSEEEE